MTVARISRNVASSGLATARPEPFGLRDLECRFRSSCSHGRGACHGRRRTQWSYQVWMDCRAAGRYARTALARTVIVTIIAVARGELRRWASVRRVADSCIGRAVFPQVACRLVSAIRGMTMDPTILGPYRVVGVLSRGPSATVYRALDSGHDDRLVALKVFAPALCADAAFRDRFRRDVGVLSVLRNRTWCRGRRRPTLSRPGSRPRFR